VKDYLLAAGELAVFPQVVAKKALDPVEDAGIPRIE